jgi:uncharacterized protein YabN with tetrapyrrole methylase and pyrophosphatase domain
LEKLDEEIAELRAAKNPAEQAAELGDVLFMLAKLATDAGLDAEAALRAASARVAQRYRYVEQSARSGGLEPAQLGLTRLLELWREAKASLDLAALSKTEGS